MRLYLNGINYLTLVCVLACSLRAQGLAAEGEDGTSAQARAPKSSQHTTLHGHIRDQYGLPRIHRPGSDVSLIDSVEVRDAVADHAGDADDGGLAAGVIDTGDFKLVPQIPRQDRLGGPRGGLRDIYGSPMRGSGLYGGRQVRMGYQPVAGASAGSLFPDQHQPWDRDLSVGWYTLPSITRTNTSLFPPLRFPATETVSGTLTTGAAQQTAPIVPPLKMVEDWNLQQRLPSPNAATAPRLLARDRTASPGPSPREEAVLWSAWYKRVADAVYAAWAARAKKAQGCVQLRINVDRARNISAAVADPLDSTRAFQQSVISAVNSLKGSDVIAFPPQSRRTAVSFEATFRTGTDNSPGARSKIEDVELVRRR